MHLFPWWDERPPSSSIEKMAGSIAVGVLGPIALTCVMWARLGTVVPGTILLGVSLFVGAIAVWWLAAWAQSFVRIARLATRQLDEYLATRRLPDDDPHAAPLDELDELLREVHDVCHQIECERCTLETDATSDHLSGLLNRRGGEARAAELVASADVLGAPWSVAVIDIDRFKQINDSLGHAVGDRALRMVASHLEQAVPTGGALVRWGGDEFLVCAPLSGDALARTMTTFLQSVEATRVASREGHIAVSASIGVTRGRRGESLADAVERADAALYRVKRAGGADVATDTVTDVGDPHEPGDVVSWSAVAVS